MSPGAAPPPARLPTPRKIKWKIEYEKSVLSETFERRKGWVRTEDDDWQFLWAMAGSIQTLFNPEKGRRLRDDQICNHFPNHYELTRKDFLMKNIKRYMKELNKRPHQLSHAYSSGNGASSTGAPYEIMPPSHLLPADYSMFVEEFRRSGPNSMWIMKPINGAQGRGIFIVKSLDQVKKWSGRPGGGNGDANQQPPPSMIVSRYIERPLLIGGRKFDLRIYVLVTSFQPLRIYLGNGFARFCHAKYNTNSKDISNPFIHLTNVSIQKRNEAYNRSHGGKWKISNLRLYLEQTKGIEATQKLFHDIDALIIHSAKAVRTAMINDRHCFECYGYDLLIDSDLKPWLIEVNASPSLNATTATDRTLKSKMIDDLIDIVVPDCLDNWGGGGNNMPPCRDTAPPHSDFVVLYDEAAEQRQAGDPNHRAGGGGNKPAGDGDGERGHAHRAKQQSWR